MLNIRPLYLNLKSTPCKGACSAIRQPGGLLQLHGASMQHFARVCRTTACTHGVLTPAGCMALHMGIQTGRGAEAHRQLLRCCTQRPAHVSVQCLDQSWALCARCSLCGTAPCMRTSCYFKSCIRCVHTRPNRSSSFAVRPASAGAVLRIGLVCCTQQRR